MASTKLSGKHNWWIVKLDKGELLYRNKNNAVYAGSDVVNGVVRKDGYLLVVDHDSVYINQREYNTDVIQKRNAVKMRYSILMKYLMQRNGRSISINILMQ